MRKIKKYTNILLTVMLLITLSSCYSLREKNYYSNKEIYIIDTALVENIIYPVLFTAMPQKWLKAA